MLKGGEEARVPWQGIDVCSLIPKWVKFTASNQASIVEGINAVGKQLTQKVAVNRGKTSPRLA